MAHRATKSLQAVWSRAGRHVDPFVWDARRAMLVLVLAMIAFMTSGCGSSPIRYERQSRDMSVDQAIVVIEKLTMMQHPAWKPDYVEFEDDYMAWDFGQVTTHRASAVAVPIGNTAVAVGRGRGTTRHSGNRVYFSDIQRVDLLSWHRKLKQWYVVSIVGFRGQVTHVLRTRYLEDAEAYLDALHVVLDSRASVVSEGS